MYAPQFKNFFGKSLWKTSYLGTSTENNLHTASLFELTKRKFDLQYLLIADLTAW